jgi:murein DD-endopeptidase MepM/ murein hydrolase activator NlpD
MTEDFHDLDSSTPRLVQPQAPGGRRRARRLITGAAVIVGVLAVFALAAVILNGPSGGVPDSIAIVTSPTAASTDAPDETPPTQVVGLPPSAIDALPTLDASMALALLQSPIVVDEGPIVSGIQYEPYTLITDRPRQGFVTYEAVAGDTISDIALRYGLVQESVAWCNDRRKVIALRPGDALSIPPADGACYETLSTRGETVADVAAQFNISDPYAILNHQANNLASFTTDQVLPGGLNVFIPGGEGPLITWTPAYDVTEQGGVTFVSFATGQAGSCGAVAPGGGSYWGNPLPSGTFVRGFYPGHTGIDLAAPPGTPIYAANSGPVLFSGWNSWGYGNTVVIGHGMMSTLYGHMTSTAVRCGQTVQTGQIIGYVGSTGNSTGPHLHFEIRGNNVPSDPSGVPGIGW